jgi:hypothetical protein
MGFWDPVGLMKDGPNRWKSAETFRRYREAEIKHGRLAMLATAGTLITGVWKFPGFEYVPDGWATLQTPEGGAGLGCILILAGGIELGAGKQDPSKEPGNLGDPLGILTWGDTQGSERYFRYTPELRNMEINHGRFAMSGFAAQALAEYGSEGFGPMRQVEWVADNKLTVAAGFLAILFYLSPDKGGERPAMLTAAEEMKALTAPEEGGEEASPVGA